MSDIITKLVNIDMKTKLAGDVVEIINSFLLPKDSIKPLLYSSINLYSNFRDFVIDRNAKKTNYETSIARNPANTFMYLNQEILLELLQIEQNINALIFSHHKNIDEDGHSKQLNQLNDREINNVKSYLQQLDMSALKISNLYSMLQTCKDTLNTKILKTLDNAEHIKAINVTLDRLSRTFDDSIEKSGAITHKFVALMDNTYSEFTSHHRSTDLSSLYCSIQQATKYLGHNLQSLRAYYVAWNEENLKAATKPVRRLLS